MEEVDSILNLREPWLRCGFYSNIDYYNNRLNGPALHSGRWWWVAAWPNRSGPWPDSMRYPNAAIWQWTDRASIPGISENTDGNIARPSDLRNLAPQYFDISNGNGTGNGVDMGWDERANVTPLTESILHDDASRRRDGLLGYAAASLYRLGSTEFQDTLARRFWLRNNPQTTLSYGAMAREVWQEVQKLREQMIAITEGLEGADTETILARIDEHAEEHRSAVSDATTKRQEILDQLSRIADGTADAETVIRRIGELLTGSDSDSESGEG
jgi:hypothetical protein